MIITYFANHYSNGGNWTHVLDIYCSIDDYIGSRSVRFELHRATHILRILKGTISKRQKELLQYAMKYREDLQVDEAGRLGSDLWNYVDNHRYSQKATA